jgi:uncharacterized membrane protein
MRALRYILAVLGIAMVTEQLARLLIHVYGCDVWNAVVGTALLFCVLVIVYTFVGPVLD